MAADELATIVDEHDNVIGAKPRHEIIYDDIYRVSALWLTNSRGDILLAQRSFRKANHPGKWGQATAGTVEPGETYEQNIYREAEEEIGLDGLPFQLGPKTLDDDAGLRRHFTQWFIATVDRPIEKFTIQREEVEQIAWVRADHLRSDIKANPKNYTPSTRKWITRLYE